jgi:O-antigen ligase
MPTHPTSIRQRPWGGFDRLQAVLFACTVVGYPLVSALPVLLEIESRLVSVPYRQVILVACLASILIALAKGYRSTVPLPIRGLLLVMLVVLTLRYVNDVVILGVDPHPVMGATEYAVFFYGVTVLPAIPLLVPATAEALRRIHVPLTFAMLLAVVLGTVTTFYDETVIDLTVRAQATTLNAISYASIGAILIMLVVALPAGHRGGRLITTVRILGMVIGAAALVISASKGPLLALLIALIARTWIRSKDRVRLLGRAGLLVLALWFLPTVLPDVLGSSSDLALLQRLSEAKEDSSTQERTYILEQSWILFKANPILGAAIAEPTMQSYPHNVVVEALMVGGLGLGLVMAALWSSSLWCALRLLRAEPSLALIGMVGLFHLTMLLISGSMYLGPDTWPSIVLLHAYAHSLPRRRRRSVPTAWSAPQPAALALDPPA